MRPRRSRPRRPGLRAQPLRLPARWPRSCVLAPPAAHPHGPCRAGLVPPRAHSDPSSRPAWTAAQRQTAPPQPGVGVGDAVPRRALWPVRPRRLRGHRPPFSSPASTPWTRLWTWSPRRPTIHVCVRVHGGHIVRMVPIDHVSSGQINLLEGPHRYLQALGLRVCEAGREVRDFGLQCRFLTVAHTPRPIPTRGHTV